MNKLIKIKENYYVINDSEIKAGDNYLWLNNNLQQDIKCFNFCNRYYY